MEVTREAGCPPTPWSGHRLPCQQALDWGNGFPTPQAGALGHLKLSKFLHCTVVPAPAFRAESGSGQHVSVRPFGNICVCSNQTHHLPARAHTCGKVLPPGGAWSSDFRVAQPVNHESATDPHAVSGPTMQTAYLRCIVGGIVGRWAPNLRAGRGSGSLGRPPGHQTGEGSRLAPKRWPGPGRENIPQGGSSGGEGGHCANQCLPCVHPEVNV